MGRERDDAPPELAAWVGGRRRGVASARTAELTLLVTAAGPAWVCRLWDGDRCVAVGRAGVGEPGRGGRAGRAAAVARACEAAGFVVPAPEPAGEVSARQTKRRRRG